MDIAGGLRPICSRSKWEHLQEVACPAKTIGRDGVLDFGCLFSEQNLPEKKHVALLMKICEDSNWSREIWGGADVFGSAGKTIHR